MNDLINDSVPSAVFEQRNVLFGRAVARLAAQNRARVVSSMWSTSHCASNCSVRSSPSAVKNVRNSPPLS